MRKISDIFISNVKLVARKSKTVLAILAVTVFIILMACIEAYVLSEISALLGVLLFLPLVFIGAVIMCTWFDLMCEWDI
jgi:ABC-type maltose transport system permease subunit